MLWCDWRSVAVFQHSLKNLHTLRGVVLSHCTALTNVDALKNLSSLRHLNLRGCTGLTNLDGLKNLSALEGIILRDCDKLTLETVDALKAALPNANIDEP